MSNNFYDILGISKTATNDDVKKAYRKLAMQYHPDKNKGDKKAEEKFKQINEAYSVLSDESKRKNYDTFGSVSGNPFSGNSGAYSNSGAYNNSGFSGFEDIFSQFGGSSRGGNSGFEDIFSQFGNTSSSSRRKTHKEEEKQENLDVNKIYEVPIFDLILGCKIEVVGENKQKVILKIPENTKPGAKFRVKGLGKSIGGKIGNLIVEVVAKMPKHISEIDKSLLERIRENVGY